jgi:hypothetical protein
MHHPQLSDVIKLPGIADLPAQVRWLFARALQAEVEWEAALLIPEPVA